MHLRSCIGRADRGLSVCLRSQSPHLIRAGRRLSGLSAASLPRLPRECRGRSDRLRPRHHETPPSNHESNPRSLGRKSRPVHVQPIRSRPPLVVALVILEQLEERTGRVRRRDEGLRPVLVLAVLDDVGVIPIACTANRSARTIMKAAVKPSRVYICALSSSVSSLSLTYNVTTSLFLRRPSVGPQFRPFS